MNTKTKTLTAAMLTAAIILLGAGSVRADANPANDSGSFTIRITPSVDLGVTVDTTGSNWVGSSNLDMSLAMGTDLLLQTPIGIAMQGNFNNQELTLTGAALNTWTLDTDEVDAQDQMRLYAMFGRSAYSASPTTGEITGAANLITTAATRAGQIQANEGGDTGHVYELPLAATEYADVDGMLSTATRKLWLRVRTPSQTSSDEQQTFTVTVTAVTGVGL